MSLTDYQTLVDDLLRDDAGHVQTAERDRAIQAAVAQYGKDRPREVLEDVVANGGTVLPLPTAWVAGRSALVSAEYPVGQLPVSIIDPELMDVVRTPAGSEIRLAAALASGEVVRLTLHLPHTLDAGSDTLPEADREPVASLAAGILLDQLARLHAQDGDSTIQADSVDRRTKADVYRSLAKAARARYHEALGLDPDKRPAASAVVNLNLADSRGRDRLTHPGRLR